MYFIFDVQLKLVCFSIVWIWIQNSEIVQFVSRACMPLLHCSVTHLFTRSSKWWKSVKTTKAISLMSWASWLAIVDVHFGQEKSKAQLKYFCLFSIRGSLSSTVPLPNEQTKNCENLSEHVKWMMMEENAWHWWNLIKMST